MTTTLACFVGAFLGCAAWALVAGIGRHLLRKKTP